MAEQDARFDGRTREPHTEGWRNLPTVDPGELQRPEDYVATDDLVAAVNVALTLGMPLLLTGEPGCGKSQLAYRLAWELGFPAVRPGMRDGEPLRFAVKSTTQASDLFYQFDTVGRFHQANIEKGDTAAVNFVRYEALGLAILCAKGRNRIPPGVMRESDLAKLPPKPVKTVVLLDEIDKAPRDVPNDILNEIESMSFRVQETDSAPIELSDEVEQAHRPVVIITSNSERDLPDAFLRRCVYFNVPFPGFDSGDGSVQDIVARRLGDRYRDAPTLLKDALALFRHLHAQQEKLNKPPSIAELLNWLDYLDRHIPQGDPSRSSDLKALAPRDLHLGLRTTLLKNTEDSARLEELLQGWQEG